MIIREVNKKMNLENVSDHYRLCLLIDSLFENTKVINEIKISIPNADYDGLVEVLKINKDFFRDRNIAWEIVHKDTGFVLRIDRVNNLSRNF